MIGKDKVPFVEHEIDSSGINMSQKRIEGAIAFTTPRTLKELQSFLGLINYFKDHIRDHALIARPLYQLVAEVTKSGHKNLTWNEQYDAAFAALKNSIRRDTKWEFDGRVE